MMKRFRQWRLRRARRKWRGKMYLAPGEHLIQVFGPIKISGPKADDQ